MHDRGDEDVDGWLRGNGIGLSGLKSFQCRGRCRVYFEEVEGSLVRGSLGNEVRRFGEPEGGR